MEATPVLFYNTCIVLLGLFSLKTYFYYKDSVKAEQKAHQATVIARENERQNLSNELHDKLGNMLFRLSLALELHNQELVKKCPDYKSKNTDLNLALELLPQISGITKQYITSLKEETLENFGLSDAISEYIQNHPFYKRNKKIIKLAKIGKQEIEYDKALHFFRAIQESIENCAKHSNANEVKISLVKKEKKAIFKIADNGIGIDFDNVVYGNGIKNIETRMRIVNGNFSMSSKPNEGTQIVLNCNWGQNG